MRLWATSGDVLWVLPIASFEALPEVKALFSSQRLRLCKDPNGLTYPAIRWLHTPWSRDSQESSTTLEPWDQDRGKTAPSFQPP
ncbi:unnamed protein product [Lampetra planeri]